MPASVIHWSDAYLGLQYDAVAFDCAALAERIRREVFGHNLKLPSERRSGPFGRQAQLSKNVPNFAEPTTTPVDGDGVLIVCKGRLQHVGIYCVIQGEPWVLHNIDGTNVTRRRVRDLVKWGYKIEGFYRWT